MRVRLPGVVLAGLFAGHAALAAPCVRDADRMVLDIAALKSQLMVTALSCGARDQYNSFVQRYRTELRMNEQALSSYFKRNYGRRGQQEQDGYITDLANAQSQTGIKQGTLFCQRNAALFDEVLTLSKSNLAAFAGSRNLTQPAEFVTCGKTQPALRTAKAPQPEPRAPQKRQVMAHR